MSKPIETVGIVGFGAMGQFMGENMFVDCEVVAHDPNITEKRVGQVAMTDLETAIEADAVVLAVPTAELHKAVDSILRTPGPGLKPDTLLVDISSVKEYPTQVMDRFLPNHNELLMCHPLFGPESAKKSLRGHRLLVTDAFGDRASELVDKWQGLGLHVIKMPAAEHDRQMAAIQAMPFIFGRLATMLGLDDLPALQTPSRLAVRKLEWLDKVQSDELFQSITEFNPQARALLKKLGESVCELLQNQAKGNTLSLMNETQRILAG